MREYYVFAFRTRMQSMNFYHLLKQRGISCQVINTPRQASIGCGISVAVDPSQFSEAKYLLNNGDFHSLGGIFFCRQNGRNLEVYKV